MKRIFRTNTKTAEELAEMFGIELDDALLSASQSDEQPEGREKLPD